MALSKTHQSAIDNSLIKEKAHQIHLSLNLSSTQLKATWLNTAEKNYIDILEIDRREQSSFEELLNSLANQSQSFASKSLNISDAHFSLVPKAVFLDEEAEKLLNFNFSEPLEKRKILSSEIESQHSICIFSEQEKIVQQFSNLFPGIKINHIAKTLIDSYSSKLKDKEEKLFIHLENSQFYLSFFKSQQLQFFNLFEFKTAEDFIYYLLYTLEQLKINREETKLLLSGNLSEKSAIYELCYKYIKNVTWLSRPSEVNYSAKIHSLPTQQHYSLYHQYLCE